MSNKKKPTIYVPDSALRNPLKLFFSMVNELSSARGLAWRIFIRNISAQYRQTALGYFWAFFPPVAMALVWVFLNSNKVFLALQTLSIGFLDLLLYLIWRS